jgi:hypothetical protein
MTAKRSPIRSILFPLGRISDYHGMDFSQTYYSFVIITLDVGSFSSLRLVRHACRILALRKDLLAESSAPTHLSCCSCNWSTESLYHSEPFGLDKGRTRMRISTDYCQSQKLPATIVSI